MASVLSQADQYSKIADTNLRKFFQNESNTILFQIIISFTFGVLFSPWSEGFAFYLIWLFSYEILYGLAVNFDPKIWTLNKRVGIICASFSGWVLGRSLANLHIFAEKPGAIINEIERRAVFDPYQPGPKILYRTKPGRRIPISNGNSTNKMDRLREIADTLPMSPETRNALLAIIRDLK